MRLKHIFFSWDFVAALSIFIFGLFVLPHQIYAQEAINIYQVGVTTLSLIFSIYFASMAFILSSSDDDFVLFLEEKEHFTYLIESFSYTLKGVFISLMYSLFFLIMNFFVEENVAVAINNKLIISLFLLIGSYSLFCVIGTTMDSIKFVKFRIDYLKIKN